MENKDQKTALSLACEHGNEELVRVLLRFNASIDHYMPIHMAVKSGNVPLVRLLIASATTSTFFNQTNESPLHIACKYNRIDVLQVLIHYQMDLEVRDHQGYTPLLTAAYFNHHACIRMLIMHGADITVMDKCQRNIRNESQLDYERDLLSMCFSTYLYGTELFRCFTKLFTMD